MRTAPNRRHNRVGIYNRTGRPVIWYHPDISYDIKICAYSNFRVKFCSNTRSITTIIRAGTIPHLAHTKYCDAITPRRGVGTSHAQIGTNVCNSCKRHNFSLCNSIVPRCIHWWRVINTGRLRNGREITITNARSIRTANSPLKIVANLHYLSQNTSQQIWTIIQDWRDMISTIPIYTPTLPPNTWNGDTSNLIPRKGKGAKYHSWSLISCLCCSKLHHK